jgi:hypothetical protein
LWRNVEHSDDPVASRLPIGFILEDSSIENLARAKVGQFKSLTDIMTFLGETAEWQELWASDIFQNIIDYNIQVSRNANKKARQVDSDLEPESEDAVSEDDDKVYSEGLISRLRVAGLVRDRNGFLMQEASELSPMPSQNSSPTHSQLNLPEYTSSSASSRLPSPIPTVSSSPLRRTRLPSADPENFNPCGSHKQAKKTHSVLQEATNVYCKQNM